jgi:hypothetical protein
VGQIYMKVINDLSLLVEHQVAAYLTVDGVLSEVVKVDEGVRR